MALDDADKKVISDLIVAALKPETIGAAVKAHLDNMKIEEKIADGIKAATKDLPKPEASDKADKDADKGKGKDDPRVAALEKQFNEERAAREKAEADRRNDRLLSDAAAALGKSGVSGERIEGAMALLEKRGLLVLDKDGVDSVLSLEDGAKAWVGTDDGKHYLPPVQTRGTGDRGGPALNANGGPVKLADLDVGGLLARINQ